VGPGDQKPKKVDALMLSHRYDDECLLLTIPEIFKMHSMIHDNDLNHGPFRQELLEMLDEIAKVLSMNAIIAPSMRRSVLVPAFDIDQTNKNPFGKVMIEIDQIKHFPYAHNIFVRVTCNPFVVTSRKVLDSQLEFHQRFFLPVHNHFNTLKIEIINLVNDGWLREHVKEHIIASFDIRLPDIDKDPFNDLGYIKLPILENTIDYKKLGLKPAHDLETTVKKRQ
jgi:hypothetical protein